MCRTLFDSIVGPPLLTLRGSHSPLPRGYRSRSTHRFLPTLHTKTPSPSLVITRFTHRVAHSGAVSTLYPLLTPTPTARLFTHRRHDPSPETKVTRSASTTTNTRMKMRQNEKGPDFNFSDFASLVSFADEGRGVVRFPRSGLYILGL